MSDLATYPKIKRLVQYAFNEEAQEWMYNNEGKADPKLVSVYETTRDEPIKATDGWKSTINGANYLMDDWLRVSTPIFDQEIYLTGMEIRDVTDLYNFYETSAPVNYDGFGTFTVAELKPEEGLLNQWSRNKKQCRLVAVMKDAVDWQTMRYSSGFCGAVEVKPEFEV